MLNYLKRTCLKGCFHIVDTKTFVHTHTHTHTSCAVKKKGLAAGILDDHDGSIVVLQAAGDLSSASFQDGDILCLHRLTVC